MSDEELSRYKGQNIPEGGHQRSSPYPSSRLAPAMDLVNIAREISQADNMVTQQTTAKLKLIAKQIKQLQDEAQKVLQQAQQDQALHHAECSFKKHPGRVYHLYRRPNGKQYFSMLSPGEWGGEPPHEFVGSFRLETDMSWQTLGQGGAQEPDVDIAAIQHLLETGRLG